MVYDNSILGGLNDLISQLNEEDDSVDIVDLKGFDETPVDLETFLYGKDYLNLAVTLSEPQFDFVDNCSRIFGVPIYTEGVLEVGQGAGKDFCSILLCLRLIYLLLCLTSPQTYFNKGTHSPIDIINIAPNARSAKNIFFNQLVSYMKNSKWFINLLEDNKGDFNITADTINFPKNINLISGNSDNESWQGNTPILIVLDEIDAFKSAEELVNNRSLRSTGASGIYDTAKSLVQSRFPNIGKVLCLSWPRFKGSFIQKRFVEGKLEMQTYVPCREDTKPYASWDFNPTISREDFDEFYERDAILARARYECDPPFSSDAFFVDTNVVLSAFDAFFDENEDIAWAKNRNINKIFKFDKKRTYYIHVDLGLSEANAALCIAHREQENVYIDRIEVWSPSPGEEIDIGGIEDYIIDLQRMGCKIAICTYDSFQSANSLQVLEKHGIVASRKSVDRSAESYHTLKDLMTQGNIIGYFDKELILELLSLDILNNNKVAKRPGMLKDRADSVAGAVHNAVLMTGTHTMTQIHDVNDVFGDREEEGSFDAQTGNIIPKVDKRGIMITGDTCTVCRNANCLEYSGNGVRQTSVDMATKMWCLACEATWIKENDWIMIKDKADDYVRFI